MKATEPMLQTLHNLPDTPGVYQFFDAEGRLLYVGKAKSLKKRVKSYFRFTPHLAPAARLGPRIHKMVSEAVRLETLLTPTESDALLLENSLIKQLKPRYNILLRDDKTYPYLYIDLSQPFARIELTRKVVRGKKIRYFGPFPRGARALLDSIYELVPLVQKRSSLRGKRACLFHQMGRCLAPCEGKIDETAYAKLIEEALGYIHDRNRLIEALQAKMASYASQLRFEEAAKIRDRIDAIESIESTPVTDLARLEDLDVFAVRFEGDEGVLVRLFVRNGRVVSSSHNHLRENAEEELEAIYRRAILSFYTEETPCTARTLLTAHPFDGQEAIAEVLRERMGRKIAVTTPQRGDKRRLVELTLRNAEELLRQRRQKPEETIGTKIRDLLGLDHPPERIEAFDNSHLAGEMPVGTMVVQNRGEWDKDAYRRYTLQSRDEYAQMEEMLRRRIEAFPEMPPPDLWVLDGGEALRRLAEKRLHQAGVQLPVVAIAKEKIDAKAHRAKGAARDLLYTSREVLRLLPGDERLHWFQRLRDEAHRYALAYHRNRRRKRDKKISLLEARGIGPAKVKRLLDYFGTFEAIREADEATLRKVLNATDAKTLKAHLDSIT